MKCNYDHKDWALLVVRLTIGLTFFLHGAQKLFGWFGGPGIKGFIAWTALHRMHPLIGYLAVGAELVGGLMMVLGLCAEIGALVNIPVMLGAVLTIKWVNGYFSHWALGDFNPFGGYEYPINLICLCAAVIIGGPGAWALWDPIKRLREKLWFCAPVPLVKSDRTSNSSV